MKVTIPIQKGKLKSHISVSVIDAHIPLILGMDDMSKLGFTIDCAKQTLTTSRTEETFKLIKTSNGQLALQLFDFDPKQKNFEECTYEDNIFLTEEVDDDEKYKRIQKIHNILCHPRADILKNFFLDSSDNSEETLKMVDKITEDCKVCKFKFKRTPSRPKVGLPVARSFNYCVALDLRGPMNNKYILYCVDSFSRLTRGLFIPNKQPATIVKGIIECWILGKGIGPGTPEKIYL